MAASATLALKAGVWFRRGRLLIVSPDSLGTACPLSGRNSTYRPVQISAAGSASLTDRLPIDILNASSITTVTAGRTVRIGQRFEPGAKLGMMLVVGPDRRYEHHRPKGHCRPQNG